MSERDLDERAWWAFQPPWGAVFYVPAVSEDAARAILADTCYRGAPVRTWPLVSTRVCSRLALAASLLRPRQSP